MNLSAIAVKRPVFTVMVTLALVVLGLTGLQRLGTDLFPDVSIPVVAISIAYPGAGPEEVESRVTKPVEEVVVSLNGLDRLQSTSREGMSQVAVLFKLGTNVEEAATQVRERIAQVRPQLPIEVREPAVSRIDASAIPVLTYSLHGKRPLPELRKFAQDVVRPAIEQVDGVAQLQIAGGAERELHVDLDSAKLDALGLTPEGVVAALKQGGVTIPTGRLTQGSSEVTVRTVGELQSVDAVRDLVIASASDGSAVRLRDVAAVEDGFAEARTRMFLNGEEAVTLEVVKQSGRNTVAVSDGVRARVEKVARDWPEDIRPTLILDQALFIRENAHEVEISIVYGGAMAILIILFFMLDLRSTLISAVALPTSVVTTFFVMYVLDFTLNSMTLLALSLAIGLLIDDAVVVRENIFKHLERGEPPMEAALAGTKEIALAVLATTLTIVAVFVPVAFMEGLVGQFFKQFGLTVSAAVLVSLFVAFTLDPMLSSRFSVKLQHGEREPFAALKRPLRAFFAALDSGYRDVLGWSVHHKAVVGVLALLALFGTTKVAKVMGADFVAPQDRGQFNVDVELPAGTSLEETRLQNRHAVDEMLQDKLVTTVLSTVGPGGDANKIRWRVLTVPKNQRSVKISVIQDRARKITAALPSAKVAVTDVQMIEGAGFQAPIMLNLRGESFATLETLAQQVMGALRSIPGVADVDMRYTPGRSELRVAIDRQRAADQGLSVAQVAASMRTAVEGDDSARLRLGDDEVPIRVRLSERDRTSTADLLRVTLSSQKGAVSLADIAHFEPGVGPQLIQREDRMRQISVWAAPHGRSLGDVNAELQKKIAAIDFPPGYALRYDGQIKQMNETNSSAGSALLLGVIFIYIVLASQFESFIHPFTIMLTLPLAMIGAVVGLFLTRQTMSMGAMIGIILLMGLVTKNAILLVDRAIERVRERGEPPLQAILEAGPERLRPILMTSAAIILGMLPTALSHGEGSEFRAPMAISVIGGVISSTLLSLVVVPAFYLAIEGAKARLGRALGRKPTLARAPGE
ncbi:MAG: efflux RND transporter permease subunit [Polyangiales bacterium]